MKTIVNTILKNISLSLFAFSTISCIGHIPKKQYYKNGSTKYEWTENKEGQLDGKFIEYYINGKVKHEETYSKGILIGTSKQFDTMGNLESLTEWNEGKMEGISKDYYSNGEMLFTNWEKGKLFGNSTCYYSDGGVKIYSCYDFKQKNFFCLNLDSNQNVLDLTGSVLSKNIKLESHDTLISVNINETDTLHIKANEKARIFLCVATPPLTRPDVYVNILNKKQRLKVKDNKAILELNLDRNGVYSINIYGILFLSNTNTKMISNYISLTIMTNS